MGFDSARERGARGFTLIETLVALVIIGIAVATATTSLMGNLGHNRRAEMVFEAAHAAQTVIDELRFENVESLPASGNAPVKTISTQTRRNYDVYVSFCSDPAYCTSNNVRQIAVRVEYQGDTLYETQTIFAAFGSAADDDLSSASSSTSSSGGSSSSASSSSVSSSSHSSSSSSSSASSSRSRGCRTWRC